MRVFPYLLIAGCSGGALTVPGEPTADLTGDPDAPLGICINELMPVNRSVPLDDGPARPDWIELHNPGAEPIVLDGWTITDDRADPDAASLDGREIAAGGWLVLLADGVDVPFTLADEGEEVGLFAPDGRGSIVRYGAVEDDVAVARAADCCEDEGCLGQVWRGTPGGSNGP